MSTKYKHLLAPIQIGNVYLKNRMIYPNACPHFLQGPEEYPTDAFIAQHAAFARSGAALVEVAEWDNFPAQRNNDAPLPDFPHMPAFNTENVSVHNYLSALAEEIHCYGSKLLTSARLELPRPKPPAPPAGSPGGPGGPGAPIDGEQVMTRKKHIPNPSFTMRNSVGMDGKKIVKPEPRPEDYIAAGRAFVEKMELYAGFGFDGVSVRMDSIISHGDHPEKTTEERAMPFIKWLQEVKRRMPDFIINVTCHGEQPLGYYGGIKPGEGYEIEDMLELMKLLDGVADIVTLRCQDAGAAHPLPYNFTPGSQRTIQYAKKVKELGLKHLLVAINGGFQNPEEIEGYMAEGIIDLISMGRTFIAEPEYEAKLKEGREADITPCIWCNLCHGNFEPPWISVCSVNPRLGMEHKLARMTKPAVRAKKVAVIGGGPAGMKAAITAAERGHKVVLFEKTDYLGGQMVHAEYFSFKWSIRDYRNWLVAQMEKAGVEVRMNTEPTPADIEAEGFDSVIAATGARPNLPGSIEGLRDADGKALYPTCYDIFGKEAELGKDVIIVGGSETGVETAMYLAENGHNVTVLTRQDELAADASHLHYITMVYMTVDPDGYTRLASAWEKYPNLKGITSVTTTKVENNVVTYRDEAGAEHTLAADSVVICGGASPRIGEAMAYSGLTEDFYAIGDCNKAGKLWKCTREGWRAGNML